jgi:hypothetical protein
MKKIIAISIIGFLICTAFNWQRGLTIDYRDAYTGTYFCKSKVSTADIIHGGSPAVDYDTLSVKVTKDVIDSVLQIKTWRNVYKMKLKSGTMYAYPEGGHRGGSFYAADSIRLVISVGHSSAHSFVGKKK